MRDLNWYKLLPISIDGEKLNVNPISLVLFGTLIGWLFGVFHG